VSDDDDDENDADADAVCLLWWQVVRLSSSRAPATHSQPLTDFTAAKRCRSVLN